jgi:hypothetical protein
VQTADTSNVAGNLWRALSASIIFFPVLTQCCPESSLIALRRPHIADMTMCTWIQPSNCVSN